MYRKLVSCIFIFAIISISGCATNIHPGGAMPSGMLVSSTVSTAQALAIDTDPTVKPKKVGESSAASFLGLFGFGDASVTAAMIEGNVSKVHHVDYKNISVLSGLFFQTTTIVYGE